ncbi:hypothetical protein QQS21_007101 [Conoideocrella luteorostrata]|uniref:Uncharacterized protein n=1 Tax=Conoideocrella luteorostrata TaxID=1105319 RepID=A0AAJ0FSE3_9HYPO|nr:hypothetical protein QQS21_007101 [Conoideocrella luteorostrata]
MASSTSPFDVWVTEHPGMVLSEADKNASGFEEAVFVDLPVPSTSSILASDCPHASIAKWANRIAREQVGAYNAKLKVFRAFCDAFENVSKQFSWGPERELAEQLSACLQEFWEYIFHNHQPNFDAQSGRSGYRAMERRSSTSGDGKRKHAGDLKHNRQRRLKLLDLHGDLEPMRLCNPQKESNPAEAVFKERSEAFGRWLQSTPKASVIVKVDWIISGDSVSCGFTIYKDQLPVIAGPRRFEETESCEAECIEAVKGLYAVFDLPGTSTQNLIICLDDLAAPKCLRSPASCLSQVAALELKELAAVNKVKTVRISDYLDHSDSDEEPGKITTACCEMKAAFCT